MNIIKLYFKIVWDKRSSIILYLAIFTAVFGIFTVYAKSGTPMSANYESVKTGIAFIDHDHSAESTMLQQFLQKKADVKDVGKSEMQIKDALFYNEVDVIVTVPNGFGKAYRKGNGNLLEIEQRVNSGYGAMLKQQMNAYLQNVYAYQTLYPDKTLQEVKALADADNKEKSIVKLSSGESMNIDVVARGLYFNYMSYVVLAIILMVVGLTMHSIYRSEILKRNSVAPMNSLSMNAYLVVSNILFGVLVWGILMVVIFLLNGNVMCNLSGLLLCVNSFLFTIMSVCMAFMFSALVSNLRHVEDVLNGIGNVVSLGFSFLGGAFVPQYLIPTSILAFSKLLPSYWYVKLNDALSAQMHVDDGAWINIWQTYGILILFAIAFMMIGLVIMRKHRSQDEYADNNNTD